MLKKEKLIKVAKEAESRSYIFLYNNGGEIEIVNIPESEYFSRQFDSNVIKIMKPENVLKHDWAVWKQKDVTIATLVAEINKIYR
jgi:hypothetical protein